VPAISLTVTLISSQLRVIFQTVYVWNQNSTDMRQKVTNSGYWLVTSIFNYKGSHIISTIVHVAYMYIFSACNGNLYR